MCHKHGAVRPAADARGDGRCGRPRAGHVHAGPGAHGRGATGGAIGHAMRRRNAETHAQAHLGCMPLGGKPPRAQLSNAGGDPRKSWPCGAAHRVGEVARGSARTSPTNRSRAQRRRAPAFPGVFNFLAACVRATSCPRAGGHRVRRGRATARRGLQTGRARLRASTRREAWCWWPTASLSWRTPTITRSGW